MNVPPVVRTMNKKRQKYNRQIKDKKIKSNKKKTPGEGITENFC